MKDSQQLIEEIAHDRSRGASELASAALEALRHIAQESKGANIEDIIVNLSTAARAIAESRPNMASLTNCAGRYMYRLIEAKPSFTDSGAFSAFAANLAFDLQWEMAESKNQTIMNTAKMLPSQGRLVTCSYSSTVVQSLVKASEMNKVLVSFVMESIFDGTSYGQMTAQKTPNCTVIPDDLSDLMWMGIDAVVIGADLISIDGTLVNGYPTWQLLNTAHKLAADVPVWLVCESSKISSCPPECLEAGFDKVSLDIISEIITEDGVIEKAELKRYLDWVVETRPIWKLIG
ncbi:MAG: hypothetical protein ACM3PP_05180 [Candidatus Saccharibacteria bacterium]